MSTRPTRRAASLVQVAARQRQLALTHRAMGLTGVSRLEMRQAVRLEYAARRLNNGVSDEGSKGNNYEGNI